MRAKHRSDAAHKSTTPAPNPAARLSGARLRAELSQHQLSNLTGISIPTISLYERGMRISRRSAVRLGAALNLDPAELLS